MSLQPPSWVGFEGELDAPAQVMPLPRPSLPPRSVAIREVLGTQQRWLTDLPLATTLLVSTHEGGHLILTTSRAALAAAQSARVPAFVGPEISALALAAEHDRASPAVLEAWCAEKLREPGFRLTPQVAVDVSERRAPQGWTVGEVLRAFGARLEAVGMGEQVPW
jgi:hypothetical protein